MSLPGGLPALDSYATDFLDRASSDWPAIGHYLRLLKQKPRLDPETGLASVSDSLRLRRHELWLRAAIATYESKAYGADKVCLFWSQAADLLIAEAWHLSGLESTQTCLLALGKLGARELNLSSDVDLILVRADHEPAHLKMMRRFQSLLADVTEFGFALRVDFALRPGGAASPAIPSLSEFENYYGYQGEMWERLAYVRMRVLQAPQSASETKPQKATSDAASEIRVKPDGEIPLAQAIQTFARKYSYRKHLDYTLLEDLKSLRAKIRKEKFSSRADTLHLKLSPGGIRELELFVHALQVIHGGRNPTLQTASTTEALEVLETLALLPPAECHFLRDAYWFLRTLENALQAFEDQQTYLLHLDEPNLAFPKLDFKTRLLETKSRVSEIATSLFGDVTESQELPESDHDQRTWLLEKGFSAHSATETWAELKAATALSRKSERDEAARRLFLKNFVTKLSENKIDRDLGLSILLDFVKATRAKASFFTLLNREPRILESLVNLFSTSPYLGSILASRPELIDEFIYRKQAEPPADFNLLLEELAERRLLAELISANHFLTDRDLDRLTENLTANADAIALTLLERLKCENGPSEVKLIALGKWGGRELGLRSDLDFVFVSPAEPTAIDQKVAKRFLSRMTESHRGGAIYPVDIRLRPSGNSGPILVSERSLLDYLQNKAAAWERQAYLRARPLANLSFSPAATSTRRKLSAEDLRELEMIRGKLFTNEKPGELDLKLVYGGLADIEFTVQIALLALGEFSLDPSTACMVQYLESLDSKWNSAGPVLRGVYRLLRETEQLYQLTTSQSGSKLRVKSDEFKRLAKLLDQSPDELESKMRAAFKTATDALKDLRTMPL